MLTATLTDHDNKKGKIMTQSLTERQRLIKGMEDWPSSAYSTDCACEYSCEYECCDRQMPAETGTWRIGRIFFSVMPFPCAIGGILSLSSCIGPGNYLSSAAMVGISSGVGIAFSLANLCCNGMPRCFGNRNACRLDPPMLCAADISTGISLVALATNIIFLTLPLTMCQEEPSFP